MNEANKIRDKFKFTFVNENNEEFECELLLSFYLKSLDKNYFLFTDHQRDEEGNLNVYAYYTEDDENDVEQMIPVTDDNEFDMLNRVYKTVVGRVK